MSRTRQFIFVHVPRTGGSSVRTAMDESILLPVPRGRGAKLMSKLFPFVPRPIEKVYLRPHESAARIRRLLPAEVFDEYRKFAFARNPYSWLVSFYEVRRKGPNHRHHKTVAAMSGFSEYVDWEIDRADRFQCHYLTDREDNLLVDFLGRYERLAQDQRRIFELLGLETAGLPHINKTAGRDYREYYDEQTKRKVAAHWARDLEFFGYDFDGLVEDRFPLP